MKKIPETEIGRLQVSEHPTTTLKLHCFCAELAKLNVDILNEQGRTYRTHKDSLNIGPNKVSIKLGKLPAGQYNAWITLGQVTAIRSFVIKKDDSMRGRFSKWFKH
ncbi:MAG: hypothetical protein HRU12_07465 [Phaeodactylibacter sp.]|nr:hypothetical protein [Phaeodactylibacter sp.]